MQSMMKVGTDKTTLSTIGNADGLPSPALRAGSGCVATKLSP
jgi:hypothetical protein